MRGATVHAPRRGGRQVSLFSSGDVSLEVACEMVAEFRDFEPGKVLALVRRGPLLFFPHARESGDGSWRVPARDVRAILGEGMPERAVSVKTLAEWCELHPWTVVKAIKRGEVRKVEIFGEWRVLVSECLRVMSQSSPCSVARRLSFFAREGDQ